MSTDVQRPTTRDHLRGSLAAPFAVLLYGDFQCPFTRQAYRALQGTWRANPDQVVWAFRHFPRPMHPQARPAGCAAEAAAAQGQFWPMADLLFRHQHELSDAVYDACAQQLELDLLAFTRGRKAASSQQKIADDLRAGREGAVTTIPALFVNGIRHCGGYDAGSVRAVLKARCSDIDEEVSA